MSFHYAGGSISAKLTRMNLLVSGAALLLVAIAFFSYDLISFRQDLIHTLQAEAEIVGANSVSALLFDDQASAAKTLQALHRSPDVTFAMLTTDSGAIFAKYEPAGGGKIPRMPVLASGELERSIAVGRHIVLAHRIIFEGNPVGVVYIAATFTEIANRARHYVAMACIILLFCMGAALLIGSASRRWVALPIISLAETARFVSRDKDYSVRAAAHRDHDEIAILIDAFNEMLMQIQTRDIALRGARDELEQRVQERTAELEAANRELQAFSYTVAHDLRGPLDTISNIGYVLRSQKNADSAAGEMLEQLNASAGDMSSLIDDLLNFSRSATAPLATVPVDLSAIAGRIAGELTTANPDRNVEFVIARLPKVWADEGLIRIVLDNLIRNSWKYTSRHDKSCIEFGAKRIGKEVVYFVRDDGAGFDPKLMNRLFQPFHRLHDKNEFSGTGIGLATVQRIISRHGGRVWAEGAVEKGATFYFTLPSQA